MGSTSYCINLCVGPKIRLQKCMIVIRQAINVALIASHKESGRSVLHIGVAWDVGCRSVCHH